MGQGGWSAQAWRGYTSQHVDGKTRQQIFSNQLNEEVNPLNFTNGIRESVDSDDNPSSTPVAIFTDMTGSMGTLAETVVKKLDIVCQELLDRAPVSDVHLMTGVVGDAYTDTSPIQASQFEADIRVAEQTKLMFLEGNGGGNGGESYALAWLLAGMQTRLDSVTKRNKKGYLFTVGDEPLHGVEGSGQGQQYGVTKEQAKRFLGLDIETDLTANQCLALAQKNWNVIHIVINSNGRNYHSDGIDRTFGVLMPDDLLYLEAVDALPELIVSAIQVREGEDAKVVAASWGGDTALVIQNSLSKSIAKSDDEEVVRL